MQKLVNLQLCTSDKLAVHLSSYGKVVGGCQFDKEACQMWKCIQKSICTLQNPGYIINFGYILFSVYAIHGNNS